MENASKKFELNSIILNNSCMVRKIVSILQRINNK